jgi:transcriptional regulator GlxA family with amidase domain
MRWPITRRVSDRTADAYFEALALLAADWLDSAEAPLQLPTSDDPLLREVMHYTDAHLTTVTAGEVSAAVGVSERTLRRQFAAGTSMTWQRYRQTSRVVRAMALLAIADQSVLDTATAVGFDSVSAFTRTFSRLTGEQPSAYRRRVRGT